MLGEAVMGLSALKTAFDMAKGLKDLDNAVNRNAAVIELQENIIAAQQAQAALIKRIDDLEKEVAGFEKWETEKEKYELKTIYANTFAYSNKPIADDTTTPHFICANCYEHRKKTILQRADAAHVFCPECKTRISFDSEAAKAFNRQLGTTNF